jgi:hypothetical protein
MKFRNIHIMAMSFIFLTLNCQNTEKEISLAQWVKDNDIFMSFVKSNDKSCENIQDTYNKLMLDEFRSKMYSNLASCSLDNNIQLKDYLLKSVNAGLHPNRIDSIKYASVYSEIKNEIAENYSSFWNDRDTTFFKEVEKRVLLDQALYHKSVIDSTPKSQIKRDSVFKKNTEYLLDYIKKYGYPIKPEVKNFNSFRNKINPTIIAIHADYPNKIKFLEHAIKSAKAGRISWNEPVSIMVTLITNNIAYSEIKPIFFLDFTEEDKVNLNESYLQLYSLKKLYSQDMNVEIKIQPSLYYKNSNSVVRKQLSEIKNILINNFNFNSELIQLSEQPEESEKDMRYVRDYKFTVKIVN